MKKTAWLVVLTAMIVAIGAAQATTSVALPEYGDGCSCHGGNPPTPADTTPPVTTSNAQASYVDSASITLTATDAGNGVAATYYTVNGGTTKTGTTVSLVGAGSYTVRFWSVDNDGNTEAAKTANVTITSSTVTPPPAPADTTAPVTTSNAQASYVDSGSITLTATDGGSGVAATYYTVNGGAQSAGNVVSLVGAGTYTVRFWSVDNAGNVESAQTASVTVTASVVTPPSPTGPTARTATIKADDSSVRRGERIKLEGAVSAAAAGERAELWVLAPGSTKWVLASSAGIEVKAAKVASASRYDDDDDDNDDDDHHAAAPTSSVSSGKWSARVTGAVKGTYQFQVRVAASSSYAAATSRTVSVRVK